MCSRRDGQEGAGLSATREVRTGRCAWAMACAADCHERGSSSSSHPIMSAGSWWVGSRGWAQVPPGALRRLGGGRYHPLDSYPLLLDTLRAGPVTGPAPPSASEWSKVSPAVDHFGSLPLRYFAGPCLSSVSTTPGLHAGAAAASLGDPTGPFAVTRGSCTARVEAPCRLMRPKPHSCRSACKPCARIVAR